MSFIIPTFPSPIYTPDFCATCLAVGRDNILLQFFPFSEDITIILKHLLHDFDVDAFIQQLPPEKELKLCQACHKFLKDMVIFRLCAMRNFVHLHNLWHYTRAENQLPSVSQTQFESAIPVGPKEEDNIEPDPLEKVKIEVPSEVTEENSTTSSIKVEKVDITSSEHCLEHCLDVKDNDLQEMVTGPKILGTVSEDTNSYVIPHINIVDVNTLHVGTSMPVPELMLNNPSFEPCPSKSAESTNLVTTDQKETNDDSEKQNSKTNKKPRDRSKEKRIPWYITVVTREEIIRNREEKLKDPKFVNTLYKCFNCAKTFKEKHDLSNHVRPCHGKSKDNAEFSCFTCGCSFETLSLLTAHAYYHSVGCHTYQCPTCDYTTGDKALIPGHVCPNEGGPKVPPKDPNMKLSVRRRNYYCPKCDFMTTQQVNEHCRRFHSTDEQVTCEACNKTYRNVHSYKSHWFHTHSGKAPTPQPKRDEVLFFCAACQLPFYNISSYRQHMDTLKHAPKEQLNGSSCKSHWFHAHSSKAPTPQPKRDEVLFFCAACQLPFYNISSYRQHMDTLKHAPKEQLKKCDECPKIFHLASRLEKHKQMHAMRRTGENLHECSECGNSYLYARGLREHIRKKHSGQDEKRNYICDVCGSAFTNNGILQKHMAKHSDDRPYKCEFCGDTFKYSGAMFTHIKLKHKKQKRKQDTQGENKGKSAKSKRGQRNKVKDCEQGLEISNEHEHEPIVKIREQERSTEY